MTGAADPADAEQFFAGHPGSWRVYEAVRAVLDELGPVEERVSRSQLAFRGHRGFAYLWLPGRWLREPAAETVLSIVLARHDPSPRFKQVVHPARGTWMHHLELPDASAVDGEVAGWLGEAWQGAGPAPSATSRHPD